MRSITVIMACLLFLALGAYSEEKTEPPAVKAYREFLDTLDKEDAGSIPVAVGRYLMDFPERPIEERDAGCVEFLIFYSERPGVVKVLLKQKLKKTEGNDDWFAMERHLELTTELKRFGLKLVPDAEGYWVIMPESGFVYHLFAPHVSESLVRFMELREPEMKGIWNGDAALAIKKTELADRVGHWSTYLLQYPNSRLYKHVERILANYLTWFLIGYDNAQIFELDAGNVRAIKKDYLDAYRYYLDKYPKTQIAPVVQKLVSAIEKDGMKKGLEVELVQKEINELISKLGHGPFTEYAESFQYLPMLHE